MTGGVRPATPRDVDAVVTLWRQLLAHHARLDPHYRLRAGGEAVLAARVEELLAAPDAALFVFDQEGALLGFASARLRVAPAPLAERCRGELLELAVGGAARRRGVGRALAGAAGDWLRARGAERVEVRVAARNAGAQAFWRALGYGDFVDVLERRL